MSRHPHSIARQCRAALPVPSSSTITHHASRITHHASQGRREGGRTVSNSQATPHKDRVRHEFTKQAENYAAASLISDPERVARLVQAVNPAPESRVLEVATGPGYVAMGFATVCREVVGID